MMTREEGILKLAEQDLARLSVEQRGDVLLDFWWLRDDDPDFQCLPEPLQREMREREEIPTDAESPRFDPLLLRACAFTYRGVRNEYLESRLAALGIITHVTGTVEPLHLCPCCGYRTLDSRGEYDICHVCFWEDDGLREPRLDLHSGPNHMTLREARENFIKHGACDERSLRFVPRDGPLRYARE